MIDITKKGIVFKRPYLIKGHHNKISSKLKRIKAINKPKPKSMDLKDYDNNNNDDIKYEQDVFFRKEDFNTSLINTNITENEDKKRLWHAAIKIPMYWVAIVPVMVGNTLAYVDTGILSLTKFIIFTISAICIIAWINISNDVFDSETGIDHNKKESLVNILGFGAKNKLQMTMYGFLIVGVTLMAREFKMTQSITSAIFLSLALFCGYIYQGPPFRLGYKGIGEFLCFVAFGPLATMAFYMASNEHLSLKMASKLSWICSILIGMTTSLILFCSHFHQVESDKYFKKLSPIILLGGTKPAVNVLKYWIILIFGISGICCTFNVMPRGIIIFLIWPLLESRKLLDVASKYHNYPEKIKHLKYFALKVHSSFGMALCIGLLLTINNFAKYI